jgi:hypothetical protein
MMTLGNPHLMILWENLEFPRITIIVLQTLTNPIFTTIYYMQTLYKMKFVSE